MTLAVRGDVGVPASDRGWEPRPGSSARPARWPRPEARNRPSQDQSQNRNSTNAHSRRFIIVCVLPRVERPPATPSRAAKDHSPVLPTVGTRRSPTRTQASSRRHHRCRRDRRRSDLDWRPSGNCRRRRQSGRRRRLAGSCCPTVGQLSRNIGYEIVVGVDRVPNRIAENPSLLTQMEPGCERDWWRASDSTASRVGHLTGRARWFDPTSNHVGLVSRRIGKADLCQAEKLGVGRDVDAGGGSGLRRQSGQAGTSSTWVEP